MERKDREYVETCGQSSLLPFCLVNRQSRCYVSQPEPGGKRMEELQIPTSGGEDEKALDGSEDIMNTRTNRFVRGFECNGFPQRASLCEGAARPPELGLVSHNSRRDGRRMCVCVFSRDETSVHTRSGS